MRLTIQYGLATAEEVIEYGRHYMLTCRLDLHPRDYARIDADPPLVWAAFLNRQQLTMQHITQGVTWFFSTEPERDAQAEQVRWAVQKLTHAVGVDNLTPLPDNQAEDD
jgi:hypothetical protein